MLQFSFNCKETKKLYENREGKEIRKYPKAVIGSFFKKMKIISRCKNKQDLINSKCLGFHALVGNRKDKYAVRLTGNWRLIMKIEHNAESKYLLIVEITDYH